MQRILFILPLLILFAFCGCGLSDEKDTLPVYATFGKEDLQRKAVVKAHLDNLPNALSKVVSTGRLSDLSVPQDNITLSKGYNDAFGRFFTVTVYLSDFYKLDLPAEQQSALYNAASLKDIRRMSDPSYVRKIHPSIGDDDLFKALYRNFTVLKADSVQIGGKNVYETVLSFDVAGEKRKSLMYVFPYNDSLVMKVRISYADGQSEVFDPAAADFMTALFALLYGQ